ncbi:MAG: mechanosensitive ion channel family protein, partial [Pseudonocardia sp.]|nr:mechanosensitive ion channel family protein [Pseudonocardia sp.]
MTPPPDPIDRIADTLMPCAKDPGTWCETFYRITNSDVLARSADAIVATTLHIALILVIALLVRYLLHRAIHRVVAGATSSRLTRVTSRIPRGPDPAESPRSVQRARTIGSVLRSIASAVVLVVASIMILAEFGVSLGPILASAGIVGVAVGFGAQNLVRDFLSGMFMLLEDQYGV